MNVGLRRLARLFARSRPRRRRTVRSRHGALPEPIASLSTVLGRVTKVVFYCGAVIFAVLATFPWAAMHPRRRR